MAFMGIFLFFVIIGILGFLLLMTVVFLIIGIVMKKKKKSGSIVLFVLSGICIAIPVALVLFLFLPRRVEIKTPDGSGMVWDTEIDDIREIVIESIETEKIDVEAVKKMVDENPELIYYTACERQHGIDHETLLEWAVYYEEYELAEFLIEHGAVFDCEIIYNERVYDTSLNSYFSYITNHEDNEQKEISFDAIEFMVNNGAGIKNVLSSEWVYRYIFKDSNISDEDVELVQFLIEKGADTYAKSGNYKPYDVLMKISKKYGSGIESDENYKAIVEILE